MNSIVIVGTVIEAPQLRYTQDNQTAIAEMVVQFPGTRDTDPPSQLKVIGWGDLAQQMKDCQVGDQHVLEGRLQVNLVERPEGFKEKVVEMRLARFSPGVGVINTIHLVGRAGRDPEVKYFESGSVVCEFAIAVDRIGRNNDQPDWFELKIWGKTAQIAGDYVRKGTLLGITGSLQFERWTDRNTGVQRSKPVIRVNQLDLLGSKQD